MIPVGLRAPLVEHCTGNAEVMGSNIVKFEFRSDRLRLMINNIFMNPNFCFLECDSIVVNIETPKKVLFLSFVTMP